MRHALPFAAAILLTSGTAHAQLHWDAAAQVGVEKRFLASQPAAAPDAGLGPQAQLSAHLALFPLVRVGGYLGHDISPMGGPLSARDLTWGGARLKVLTPWPRGTTRAWVFAGFGYDGVYARSSPGVAGAGGGFFEVPFGIGASYTFWKPWAFVVELGGRVGFGHSGNAYGSVSSPGEDRFGLGLSVGILLDR